MSSRGGVSDRGQKQGPECEAIIPGTLEIGIFRANALTAIARVQCPSLRWTQRRLAQVNAKAALEICSIWNKKLRAVVRLGFRASHSSRQRCGKMAVGLQNSIQIDLRPVLSLHKESPVTLHEPARGFDHARHLARSARLGGGHIRSPETIAAKSVLPDRSRDSRRQHQELAK